LKGTQTTRSPEEIRHLAFSRRVRGYAPDEVDRLLAEIADSFEAVWHERTSLYEEVVQLREQLRQEEAAIAELRDEGERTKVDRDALLAQLELRQAEVRELRAAVKQVEHPPRDHTEEEYGSSAEGAQLRSVTEELRKERDRVLDEIRRGGAAAADERKKLLEFLLDALKQVEGMSSNGLDAAAQSSDLHKRRESPRNEDRRSSGSASADKNTVPPSHWRSHRRG
jgi:DivIVA domain-containing protein